MPTRLTGIYNHSRKYGLICRLPSKDEIKLVKHDSFFHKNYWLQLLNMKFINSKHISVYRFVGGHGNIFIFHNVMVPDYRRIDNNYEVSDDLHVRNHIADVNISTSAIDRKNFSDGYNCLFGSRKFMNFIEESIGLLVTSDVINS